MPLVLIDQATGQEVASIDESTPFAVGQAWTAVTSSSMGKSETRSAEQLTGSIVIQMPLPAARRVAGKRVVVFVIEQE